jgi:hypothetical protein
VSLSANLLVGLRLPERMIKKQLTPLYVVIGVIQYYHHQGKHVFLFQSFKGKLSKFTSWKKLNASYVMSATDYPPRCKDKKNLANDIHCELYFLQNYFIFLNFSDFESIFFS